MKMRFILLLPVVCVVGLASGRSTENKLSVNVTPTIEGLRGASHLMPTVEGESDARCGNTFHLAKPARVQGGDITLEGLGTVSLSDDMDNAVVMTNGMVSEANLRLSNAGSAVTNTASSAAMMAAIDLNWKVPRGAAVFCVRLPEESSPNRRWRTSPQRSGTRENLAESDVGVSPEGGLSVTVMDGDYKGSAFSSSTRFTSGRVTFDSGVYTAVDAGYGLVNFETHQDATTGAGGDEKLWMQIKIGF